MELTKPPIKKIEPTNDRRIVRQSCLKNAVEFCKEKAITKEGMFNIAKEMEDWVYRGVD